MTGNTTADRYDEARRQVEALCARPLDLSALYDSVCRALHETLPDYTWVGIYLVEGHDLVLAAWQGPAATAHVRIPIGEGICGYAAAHGESIIVPDVSRDSRYLQCFLDTRSEIVVPIIGEEGRVLGELDVDGRRLDAFGPDDRALLEFVAQRLADVAAGRESAV